MFMNPFPLFCIIYMAQHISLIGKEKSSPDLDSNPGVSVSVSQLNS